MRIETLGQTLIMDRPIAIQTRNSDTEGACRNSSRSLFFSDSDQPSDPLEILFESQAELATPALPTELGRRTVLLLVAASLAGSLAFASIRWTGWDKSAASVHPNRAAAAKGVAAINALPAPNLLKPVSPDQATQVNAERPFAERPDTPATRFLLRTDAGDHEKAITCLAQAVYYEAAGEGVDGGRAVAQVVLNRVRHPGFPSTICGVVYQGADKATGCQFSFTCDGSMQRVPVPALWTRSRQIAEDALKGRVFAAVGHATHYHADYVLPYWADSLDKSIKVGRHIFYRLPKIFGDANAFTQRYGGLEQPFTRPSGAIVLPPAVATEQLATTLISDGLHGSSNDGVEKASTPASSPLQVDGARGALLADAAGSPISGPARRRAKTASECSNRPEGKVAPMSANDMRSSTAGMTC